MSEEKFFKEINKAKKGDIVIWNEATGEIIRGQANEEKVRYAILRMIAYKYHKKSKEASK